MNPRNIPRDLRTRPRWLCWVLGEKRKDGKRAKVPVSARTSNANIDATDYREWASLDDAMDLYGSGGADGIGFALAPGDPYAAVDLDGCVDPATRTIAPWADAIRSEFGTYSEVSPSGTGLRLVGFGRLDPAKKHNATPIEVYDRKRYVTITGHRLPDAPLTVADCTAQFRRLQDRITPSPVPRLHQAVVAGSDGFQGPDAELLANAFAAKNGSAVQRLWRGPSGTCTPSQDLLALANYLAFWAGPDAFRLERLVTGSPLFVACESERAKWFSPRRGGTWGQMFVIAPAIKGCPQFFAGAAPLLPSVTTPHPVEVMCFAHPPGPGLRDAWRRVTARESVPGFGADDPLGRLASLCWHLAGRQAGGSFFLAVRDVEQLVGVSIATASRWLKRLRDAGVIQLIKRGNYRDGMASEFLWLGA